MKKYLAFSLAAAAFLAGCSDEVDEIPGQNAPMSMQRASYQEPAMSPDEEAMRLMVFSASGEGIAPQNTVSQAQALALAKRAAVADAYRSLGEKLYGVRVNSRENVKDAMLRSSSISMYVDGLIKGAQIVGEGFKNGLYTVELELKIDKYKWNELFSY